MFNFFPPIVQAAMAGIANKDFCQQMIDLGAGLVTFGGYPADKQNIQASTLMISRGRKEIIPPIKREEFSDWFVKNLEIYRKDNRQKIAVNLRIVEIDQITINWLDEIRKKIDFLELNVHCRQKEVLDKGAGEALLRNLTRLEILINNLTDRLKNTKLGVKIRGCSITDLDSLMKILNENSISYLHVDAMVKGKNMADLQLIKKISNSTNIPIIGNNSVRSIEDVKKMLEQGASAVSLARPLITNPLLITELINQLD